MVGGLALDILTRVINVHWAGGLAVEFGNMAEDAPGMTRKTERVNELSDHPGGHPKLSKSGAVFLVSGAK
jgi:hypothetical protein